MTTLHGRPAELVTITIVEGSSALLPGVDAWVQKTAQKRLEKLCVQFVFEKPIERIEKNIVILNDGSSLPFHCLIWTAGVRANHLTSTFSEIKPEKNLCMAVDSHLRIKPYANVFSVGDVTYCVDEATGKSLPMTATVALREANCVAQNIKHMLAKKSLCVYRPSNPGFVIPLGGKYAIFETHRFHIAGFLPWILKNAIALHYWVSIIGLRKGFQVWWRGARIFARND